MYLTLHSEKPKLYGGMAVLSAIGLKKIFRRFVYSFVHEPQLQFGNFIRIYDNLNIFYRQIMIQVVCTTSSNYGNYELQIQPP